MTFIDNDIFQETNLFIKKMQSTIKYKIQKSTIKYKIQQSHKLLISIDIPICMNDAVSKQLRKF